MDFLDTILTTKAAEVREYCQIFPTDLNLDSESRRSLKRSLESKNSLSVIAEIKKGSPSKGHFAPELNIPEKVRQYERSGATAISVLTDKQYFYGGYSDLKLVREHTDLPILCKDFIIDTIQIDLAKYYGADAILLIVAALPDETLKSLQSYAYSIGLEVLMEVHNENEMKRALALDQSLIGINNRNLKTFKTDIQKSLDLIDQFDTTDIALISESGISSPDDAQILAQKGFHGVLVGESLITKDSDGTHLKAMSSITRSSHD